MASNENGTKKTRIIIDLWIARIGSYFAWFWLAVWVLAGITGISDLISGEAKDSMDWFIPFICLGIAALNFLMVRSFRRTKALIADFRLYSSVWSGSGSKSVRDVATKLKKDPELIRERILEMCRRGYYSGQFDFNEQAVVFNDAVTGPSIRQCPGCGATNTVQKTGDKCVYCGSPLKKE